jgi:hypothetical protein
MTDKFRQVKVIKADGKYVDTVFTGIGLPPSEWNIVFTENKNNGMIFRPFESAFFNMLQGVFPEHDFTVEVVDHYLPCGCSVV